MLANWQAHLCIASSAFIQLELESTRIGRYLLFGNQCRFDPPSRVQDGFVGIHFFGQRRVESLNHSSNAEHLLAPKGSFGMYLMKFSRCISTSAQHDGNPAARVILKVVGEVKDLVVNHNPAIILLVVLGHLVGGYLSQSDGG